ncbi:alpha/beta fold hydrolase [Flavobacterium oreochromis]|uniref:AB hydrolase-1 domain-containing protein n=3 Tax=Flavobacterium TaxID=237 RepID=A0A246GAF4_9FLAO|nr:alpha/beta hydrolase [Flavobacterium oreochromis]OWP75709.1 hypothetical protein BWG23_10145 [Flavobacterium oreochromis]OWP76969.1 hypothetical protein BWK62_08445 [Flavobacterium oreochromis]
MSGQVEYGSNNGKYLQIQGTKIYYEEYGSGTPLLLLHGGFGNIADYSSIIPELAKKHRIIAADAPGLGKSEYPKQKLSYQLLANYQSELIDQLKLDSLYVLGWSDGAVTGLLLAKKRPDKVKKLIVSGANYKANAAKDTNMLMNWSDPNWIEKNWPKWVENYKKNAPSKDWKRYLTETRQMWFEEQYFPTSHLEAIKIPTLIIYGDNDMYTLEHGLEIKNAIKNSQFCVLPNCSHDVFMEKPDLITQLIVDFLK